MTISKSLTIKSFLIMLISAFAVSFSASAESVYLKKGFGSWDAAVDGYDVVSYFEGDAPVQGRAEFSTEYLGVNWYFSNQENLDRFVADPDAYRPQYGGHCAWAMANGKKAPGNPKVYKVVDGKLYLNVSKGVQKKWLKDIPGFIEAADQNWANVTN